MNTEFTLNQRRAVAIFTIIALLFGAYFLRDFFVLIVVAAVGAYLFTPLSIGSTDGWAPAYRPPAPCCRR